MIVKEIKSNGADFTVVINSANAASIRTNELVINKVAYNGTVGFDVKEMILTENYSFVNRQPYFKDATYEQKRKFAEVLKTELFNYLFSNPELLEEAQTIYNTEKLATLIRERKELELKVASKEVEIDEFMFKIRAE